MFSSLPLPPPCLGVDCDLSVTNLPVAIDNLTREIQTLRPAAVDAIGEAIYASSDATELAKRCWMLIGGLPGLGFIGSNSSTLNFIIKVMHQYFPSIVSSDEVDWFQQLTNSIEESLPFAIAEDTFSHWDTTAPRLHALNLARMYSEAAGRVSAIAEHHDCTILKLASKNL